MFAAIGHDFVLRRNVRVALSNRKSISNKDSFVSSTSGSHHIRLVSHNNSEFNRLLEKEPNTGTCPQALPTLLQVHSGEKFGLVPSAYTETYGGLLTIKEEVDDNLNDILDDLDEQLEDQMIQMTSVTGNSTSSDITSMPAKVTATATPDVLYVIVSHFLITELLSLVSDILL